MRLVRVKAPVLADVLGKEGVPSFLLFVLRRRESKENPSIRLLAVVLVACSPEAARSRGSGPGADIGNYSPSLPQPSTPPPLPGG